MGQNLEDNFAYQDTGNAHINNDVIAKLYGNADLTSAGNSNLINAGSSAQSTDGAQTGLPIVMVFDDTSTSNLPELKKETQVGPPIDLANPDNRPGRDPSDRLPGQPPRQSIADDSNGSLHNPPVRRGGGRTAPNPVAI